MGLILRAPKNLLRAVRRDLVWAITTLVTAPYLAGKMVFKGFVFLAIGTFALGLLNHYVLNATGLGDSDLARLLTGNLVLLFAAVLAFRLVTAPLILHFGDKPKLSLPACC
ncbi:hypothetical protein LH464_09050 [Neorhizobium sp. T786]|uniref:hypothetical protein n=1 Tax=Pseudorhizobium xiangyangii TaxID=2883104 RepID=UPI001CFF8FA7|nr:hypothetical protein [Neorhizobium xiangyangii]MCB5202617.1 hypothetical protein [Neorhizobium xiangyangii]